MGRSRRDHFVSGPATVKLCRKCRERTLVGTVEGLTERVDEQPFEGGDDGRRRFDLRGDGVLYEASAGRLAEHVCAPR